MLYTDREFHDLTPYTLAELSNLYKVTPKTIKKWLKPYETEIGPRNGRFYTVKQVKIIFKSIGFPTKFIDDEN